MESLNSELVFQCIKCNAIVSDSHSFIRAIEEMRVVILSSASNVERGRDIFTSKSGIDVGSTYFTFSCCGCQVKIFAVIFF